MEKISFSDGIGIAGIVFAIVLVVLDKSGKLKGGWLFGLLFLAGVMTLFLAIGNSWVLDAPAKWRIWRGFLMLSVVAFSYSGAAIWISGDTSEGASHPKAELHVPPEQIAEAPYTKEHDEPDRPASTNSPLNQTVTIPGTEVDQQVEVDLIFKESSLFTDERKTRITRWLGDYRHYLIALGFDTPRRVPPIGVSDKRSDSVLFPVLFKDGHNPKDQKGMEAMTFNVLAAEFISDYYTCSYLNLVETDFPLQKALRKIRQTHQAGFMDKVMFYTVQRWNTPLLKQPEVFEQIFAERVMLGAETITNSDDQLNEIRNIFKENGILKAN